MCIQLLWFPFIFLMISPFYIPVLLINHGREKLPMIFFSTPSHPVLSQWRNPEVSCPGQERWLPMGGRFPPDLGSGCNQFRGSAIWIGQPMVVCPNIRLWDSHGNGY